MTVSDNAKEFKTGELLMEFPRLIKSIEKIGERLFVSLEGGQTIEITELLGEAKH